MKGAARWRLSVLLGGAMVTSACDSAPGPQSCPAPSEPKTGPRDPLPIRATPAILPTPAAPAEDGFGYALALAGDTLVVGAPLDSEQGKSAGAVHVLTWDGNIWVEEAKLLASDGHELQKFGKGVAIDGDTIVVSGEGAGYVFVRAGEGAGWRQQWKIVPPDTGPNLQFSLRAVSGDWVMAGDIGQRPYIFQRRNDRWSEQARLESAGSPVGLEGDTAILSGWRLVGAVPDVTALNVYTRTCGSWVHEADLTPDDGTVIGSGVAFEGDTAAIQATPEQLVPPDRIHVFRRSGSLWAREATVTSPTAFSLGGHIAVAGDRMVAGEMVTENLISRARIFTRAGTTWTDTGSLVPTSPLDAGHTFRIIGIAMNDRHVALATQVASDATHPGERSWVFVY